MYLLLLLLFEVGNGDGVVPVIGVVVLEGVEGGDGDALRVWRHWDDVVGEAGGGGGVVGLGKAFVEDSSLELQPPHRSLRFQHLEHQLIIIEFNLLHLLTQLLVLVLVLLVFCARRNTIHSRVRLGLVPAFCCGGCCTVDGRCALVGGARRGHRDKTFLGPSSAP